MPETGWRRLVGNANILADVADDEDEADYEVEDPLRNLDLSRREDYAQWKRTPFSIAAGNRRAKELRDQAKQGPFEPISRAKTTEELLAEQEEADRRGGGNIEPAVEQPKASKENMTSKGGWTKQYKGWVNGSGQPVAASKPPGKKQTSIMEALQKLDKGQKGKGRKRKAGADEEQSARVASPPAPPAPKPKPKPKTIAERLDEVEKGNQAKKAKAVPEEKQAITKGIKSNSKKDEDTIKFSRLPSGAATNTRFPIVKGFEKMKTMPVKKPIINSSSPPSSPIRSIPSLDFLGMLSSADRADEKRRQDRQDRAEVASKAILGSPKEEDEDVVMLDEHPTPVKVASTSIQAGQRSGTSGIRKPPSLDHTNPTEPTDTFLTPHQSDDWPSNGNPSTITHLSDTIPHFPASERAGPSSSSQLPYSSPALDKARRQDGLVRPRPVRDASRDIVKLEHMAKDYTPPPKKEPNAGPNKGFAPPAPIKPHAGFRLAAGVVGQQPPTERDMKPKLEPKDEEWSTLKPSQTRFSRLSLADKTDQYGYREPATPSHKVPRFRQSQDNAPQKTSSRMSVFKPRPPIPHVGEQEYTLAPVPNGAKPTYQVEPMQWTSQQQRRAAAQQAPPRQEAWVREAQKEFGNNKRARANDDDAEDWMEQWKRQGRRQIEENPHKRYAYAQNGIDRRDVGGGRAFAL